MRVPLPALLGAAERISAHIHDMFSTVLSMWKDLEVEKFSLSLDAEVFCFDYEGVPVKYPPAIP